MLQHEVLISRASTVSSIMIPLRMARRTSTAVVEPLERVQRERSFHWSRIHRGVHSNAFRRMSELTVISHNLISKI